MKIRGALVDMLVDLDPLIYKDYISIVNGKKICMFKYQKQSMECYNQHCFSIKKIEKLFGVNWFQS